MKIPNKREVQQIAINNSSVINSKAFINNYEKCTTKPYSFEMIDTTLTLYNILCFRKNLSEII